MLLRADTGVCPYPNTVTDLNRDVYRSAFNRSSEKKTTKDNGLKRMDVEFPKKTYKVGKYLFVSPFIANFALKYASLK